MEKRGQKKKERRTLPLTQFPRQQTRGPEAHARMRIAREYSHLPSFALRCRIFYIPCLEREKQETKKEETGKKTQTHTQLCRFFNKLKRLQKRDVHLRNISKSDTKKIKTKKHGYPSRTSGPHHTPPLPRNTHTFLDLRYD